MVDSNIDCKKHANKTVPQGTKNKLTFRFDKNYTYTINSGTESFSSIILSRGKYSIVIVLINYPNNTKYFADCTNKIKCSYMCIYCIAHTYLNSSFW